MTDSSIMVAITRSKRALFNQWLLTHRPTYLDVFYVLNLGYVDQYITVDDMRVMIYNMCRKKLSDQQLLCIYNTIMMNIRKFGPQDHNMEKFNELVFITIYAGLYFNNIYNDMCFIDKFYNEFYEIFIHNTPNAFNKMITNIRFHLM